MFGQHNPIVRITIIIHNLTIYSVGPVKNVNPGPSVEVDAGPPWMPRRTTYPTTYILTTAVPALLSLNRYKPTIECPPTQSWRVPDPYDCSIYHECRHGVDLVSYCPAQLYYNPKQKTCDHPKNVRCKSK